MGRVAQLAAWVGDWLLDRTVLYGFAKRRAASCLLAVVVGMTNLFRRE